MWCCLRNSRLVVRAIVAAVHDDKSVVCPASDQCLSTGYILCEGFAKAVHHRLSGQLERGVAIGCAPTNPIVERCGRRASMGTGQL
jgi:hypothetical protein